LSASLFPAEQAARRAIGGHHSAGSDSEVWLTPPHILQALGPFDLDPCACMSPRPWSTAARHLTRGENGLMQPWHGRVWCNPPYGGPGVIAPWVQRLADHGCGTLLVFARTETSWFHAGIWRRATAILFLEGRLHFHRPDGSRAEANAGAPSCLAAYGASDAAVLRTCGLPGRWVAL
jgi:hypothetical protein